MTVSLIDIITKGGCYWKRDRDDSPGHSFAVPNQTLFKIAIEGPQSHRFEEGICRDGRFHILTGERAGESFRSASEAVNSVREPSSNAFLYLHFQINGTWISADEYRRAEWSRLDEAEEMAFNDTLADARSNPKNKGVSYARLMIAVARHVAKNPQLIEIAQSRLSINLDLDLSMFSETTNGEC